MNINLRLHGQEVVIVTIAGAIKDNFDEGLAITTLQAHCHHPVVLEFSENQKHSDPHHVVVVVTAAMSFAEIVRSRVITVGLSARFLRKHSLEAEQAGSVQQALALLARPFATKRLVQKGKRT